MCAQPSTFLLAADTCSAFPDPRWAHPEGLIAVGGDLRVERLLLAYDSGIFPFYDRGQPILWWSPDPRAVLEADTLHVSRSMRRILRRGEFELSWNTAFEAVIRECAHRPGTSTWILPEMIDAYLELNRHGHAHSLEVWAHGRLAGGLYGVQRGALFAAESMFYRVPNASKVAVTAAVRGLFAHGIRLFDVQYLTPHLASLGAIEIPRRSYLARLHHATRVPVDLSPFDPASDLSCWD